MIGLGAKKQVLLVGNDGVQLYVVKGKTVSLYQDFTHSGGSLTSDLKAAFATTKLPLIVLFDVAEQQYRREAIPKVSFLDKSKVINRKLAMAFPQQLFRAFYLPKQKDKENEAMLALFAGLSASLTIMQIMDALLGSEIYIEGAALLPLESISLVTKIASELQKKYKKPNESRWHVLMTQEKTGGLRQIVVKDGELALTRMTPLIVDIDQPEALGNEMIREFNSTLTYLSRFGYVPADGLDLYLVSHPSVTHYVGSQRLAVNHFYELTLMEACQLAGLKPAVSRDAPDYGELLHSGWVALQSKLMVSLSSPVLDKVKQARLSARIIIFAALVGIAYLGWQITSLQSNITTMSNDIKGQETQKNKLKSDFEELTSKQTPLKYDPDKIKAVLDTYDENSKKMVDIMPTINALIPLLDHDKILLKEMNITEDKDATSAAAAGQDPSKVKPNVQIEMTLGFPDKIKIEQDALNTLEFADKLKKRFPGRIITVTDIIGNLALDKTVQGKSEAAIRGQGQSNEGLAHTSKVIFKGALE